jgi:putative hydrolase of HD superfamily
MIGVENPESVAEHSLRAAQIAWVLARMEEHPNPHEVVTMVIFHDMAECRVGDIHKLGCRYVTVDETTAIIEQASRLGPELGPELVGLWQQKADRSTAAGIIAKDADYVELAVRAREYIERGYTEANEWFESARRGVQTKSAKELLEELPKVRSSSWWEGLKKVDR